VCGTTVVAAGLALASAGCSPTSSSTTPAAPASSASATASASTAASVSAAASATTSPAAPSAAAASPTATASQTATASPTATATGASAPTAGAGGTTACTTFAAAHSFLHLTGAKASAGGTLTVTGVPATMVCGGPDDFHYNYGTGSVTGHVLASATIAVLNSALQPTPMTLAKFPGYLASDMNVRVFTYTGPRTAITALGEQFHP
jgi:hypothetical protein